MNTYKSAFLSVVAAILVSTPLRAESASVPTSSARAAIRLDCLHDFNIPRGSTQGCMTLRGLRIEIKDQLSQYLEAMIALDPWASVDPVRALLPVSSRRISPRNPLGIIADYGIRWQFRPNLKLALEQFGGSALLPSVSQLAFGPMLQEAGWYQTAVTAEYKLAFLRGLQVKLALGNGEGENGTNLDAQQFGGIEIQAGLADGLALQLGLSYDGNNSGSQAYNWQFMTNDGPGSRGDLGFSTERLAAALYMDGSVPGARGLSAMLGVQKVRQRDLSKSFDIIPSTFAYPANQERIGLGELMVEDPSHSSANVVERSVQQFSLSYLILAEYFFGFDYAMRRISSGEVSFFKTCNDAKAITCENAGPNASVLNESGYALGLGTKRDNGLKLVLEYSAVSYNKIFEAFNYLPEAKSLRKSREAFNARLSYNW